MKTKELEKNFKIYDINCDEELTYELSKSNCSWIKSLLEELQGDPDFSSIEIDESDISSQSIVVDLQLNRKYDSSLYLDHLIVCGTIKANYLDRCIKCLDKTLSQLTHSFSVCFLPEQIQNEDTLKDVDTIYINDKESEVYFYKKKSIEIYELIHELIYLHKNPFPLHSKDCKGLCMVCGTNLNKNLCTHTHSH